MYKTSRRYEGMDSMSAISDSIQRDRVISDKMQYGDNNIKPRSIRVDRCKPTRRIVADLSVAVAEVRNQFINTDLSSLLRSM